MSALERIVEAQEGERQQRERAEKAEVELAHCKQNLSAMENKVDQAGAAMVAEKAIGDIWKATSSEWKMQAEVLNEEVLYLRAQLTAAVDRAEQAEKQVDDLRIAYDEMAKAEAMFAEVKP